MTTLLQVQNVSKRFGGLVANEDVSFDVAAGQVVGLIGPNGAGKTTMFNCVAGYFAPSAGNIVLEGRAIGGLPPEACARAGVARTFQIARTFTSMTACENVMTAAMMTNRHVAQAREAALRWLAFTGLQRFADKPAASMTISEQRRLAVARALALQPRIVLMDEVMAGLNPSEVREAVDVVLKIREQGMACLIVEHVLEGIMPIADKIVVLDRGRKIAEGTPQQVSNDPVVITAYLGADAMLELKNLKVCYGSVLAVSDVSLTVAPGQIVALVGGNGNGKSTTLRAVAELNPLAAGSIHFNGQAVHGVQAHNRVPLGLSLVPEGRRLFPRLTVKRNLELGAYTRQDKHEVAATLDEMLNLFPILKERAGQLAGTMSGGEQQMLAIARGLMARPKLLMLDEPSWGIAPKFVTKVLEVIQQVNALGVSILLVEQNLQKALHIAHQGYVIQTGRIVMQGSGQDLLNNDQVKKAYLGL